MIEIQFRATPPKRTYEGAELPNYRDYKSPLSKDFNERCGYTDCPHFWFGGKGNFQIDHFMPISLFPALKTTYSNLVYSCSYVNRAKSNSTGEFLDPCDTDYNLHFYRNSFGNIFPREESEAGRFMYKKLKLYLKRYGIIWMLDQLMQKKEILRNLIEKTNNQEAKDVYLEVDFMFCDYLKYLKAEQ